MSTIAVIWPVAMSVIAPLGTIWMLKTSVTVTGRSLSTRVWRSTQSNVSLVVIDHRTNDRLNHKTHIKVNTAGVFRNDHLTRPGSDSDRDKATPPTQILAPFTTQDANSIGKLHFRKIKTFL